MRRARYSGLPTTRLKHVFSGVASNLIRLDDQRNVRPLDRAQIVAVHLKRAGVVPQPGISAHGMPAAGSTLRRERASAGP